MWREDLPADDHLRGAEIAPETVLYEFDGPRIFTAKMGMVTALFCKVQELSASSLYVACVADPDTLGHLTSGKLSVRGAFDQDTLWIVELDFDLRGQRYWGCRQDDLPERLLPAPGAALYHWFGRVPDSVQQAESLVSIKYSGSTLRHSGMPFGRFKDLVDKSHRAIRKILTPTVLVGSRSSSFDYEIAQPKFASLVISVKSPVFNTRALKRHSRAKNIDPSALRDAVLERQQIFTSSIKTLNEFSQTGNIDRQFASDRYALIDMVAEVLPTEESDISGVEFTTNVGGNITSIRFDRDSSSMVRTALRIAEEGTVVEIGKVVALNAKSMTLTISSTRGRDTRCEFPRERFEAVLDDRRFRVGVLMKLGGRIERRARIDRLEVEYHEFIRDEDVFA